jgi:hypothetical protein
LQVKNLRNTLNLNVKINHCGWAMVAAGLTKEAGRFCVFFTQHLGEKRHSGLWEQPFFIARKTLLANVNERRRGHPRVALSGLTDRTKRYAQA